MHRLNILDPKISEGLHPLWRLAFRPGFLFGAAFAALSLIYWVAVFSGMAPWQGTVSPFWWHGHEMLFGFGLAIAVGFLLTAVQTWTGIPGTEGSRLQWLFGSWLLARLSLLMPFQEAWLVALTADAVFVLLALGEFGSRVLACRQWRNLPPVLLIGALGVLNGFSYALREDPAAVQSLHYGVLNVFALLMVFMGGRVIPFFTARRMGWPPIPNNGWLDRIALLTTVFVVAAVLAQMQEWAPVWQRILYLIAGIANLLRLQEWRGWRTWRQPLLWSLHLSYAFIPLTFLLMALAPESVVAQSHVLHLLAIGAMGGMILAMTARVSLGHTGRPLEISPLIALALACIAAAAVLRGLLPIFEPAWLQPATWLAGGLWTLGFSVFLFYYVPVLLQPRVDGRPG